MDAEITALAELWNFLGCFSFGPCLMYFGVTYERSMLDRGDMKQADLTGTNDIMSSIDLKFKITAIMTNVTASFLSSCFPSYL